LIGKLAVRAERVDERRRKAFIGGGKAGPSSRMRLAIEDGGKYALTFAELLEGAHFFVHIFAAS
jgi:hypothetical protein